MSGALLVALSFPQAAHAPVCAPVLCPLPPPVCPGPQSRTRAGRGTHSSCSLPSVRMATGNSRSSLWFRSLEGSRALIRSGQSGGPRLWVLPAVPGGTREDVYISPLPLTPRSEQPPDNGTGRWGPLAQSCPR